MPIKFRCPHCQQFLGISRNRAGAVTDCPMCGRTIRVPDVDGTVQPLPGLELNHLDTRLASALDKLAGIGVAAEPERDEDELPHIEERPAAAGVLPTPLPDPIEIAPAPLPRLSETPSVEPRTIVPPPRIETMNGAGGATASVATDPGLVLAALAEQAPSSRTARSNRFAQPVALVLAALLGASLFAAGFVTGRWGTASLVETNAATAPPAAAPQEPVAVVDGAAEGRLAAALTGRITYVSDSGDSLPDSGARILVLPQERQGTGLLPVEGVRASAEAGDLRLTQAAVRALGGDLAVADNDGHYSVQLTEPGLYHVVILSRYQPGPQGAAPPADAAAVLQKFFERPAQVAGNAACHVSEFRYRGSGTSPRDHSFERS